jgi:hypothetical protein
MDVLFCRQGTREYIINVMSSTYVIMFGDGANPTILRGLSRGRRILPHDPTIVGFTGIRDSVNSPTLGFPLKILGVSSHSGTSANLVYIL